MDGLVEFLRARYDELEVDVTESRALVPDDLHWSMPDWLDRNYLLADIAAKRRIVDLHAPQDDYAGRAQCAYCADLCHSHSGLGCDEPDAPYPCEIVKILAAPFSTHPDYNSAWAV